VLELRGEAGSLIPYSFLVVDRKPRRFSTTAGWLISVAS